MRWVDAATALLAELHADAALIAALGGPHIYRSGEYTGAQIPALYHHLVVATLDECFEPFVWQWGVFARDLATALTIEGRLRKRLDRKTFRQIGGIMMSARYEDSRDHDDPEPGVIHRSLDFRVEPVRER